MNAHATTRTSWTDERLWTSWNVSWWETPARPDKDAAIDPAAGRRHAGAVPAVAAFARRVSSPLAIRE